MPYHLNPNGVCHGGMLASFCDVYLAMAGIYAADIAHVMAPTVGLALDFLGPTPADAWVEGRAELLRAGRSVVVVQGLLSVDGRPVVRANGSFAIPSTPLPPEVEARRVKMRRLLRGEGA
jgi:uncharacterized protein (TIGR00369 family)